jgi:hypothetical protein
MAKKLFFTGFGAFTLASSLISIIYGGFSNLMFLPLGLFLLVTGIKLKTKTCTQKERLVLKRIKFLMKGKSDAYIKTNC